MNIGPEILPLPQSQELRQPQFRSSASLALLVLLLIDTQAYLDRQILSLVMPAIKKEFALTDTMVSMLPGFAFVLPFVLVAPFAGRVADTMNRKLVCAFAVITWSLATIGSGLATSYALLFFTRILLGAAQAFLIPAAWSLMSDYFSTTRLPRAISIFTLGPYLGSGLALILGGVVLGAFSTPFVTQAGPLDVWRIALVAAGLTGTLPLLLLWRVREPPRGNSVWHAAPEKAWDVYSFMWTARAYYAPFYCGMAFQTVAFSAIPIWMPSFLSRRFDAELSIVGLHYGVATLIMGCIGVLGGPILGRALLRAGFPDYQLRIAFAASLAAAPLTAGLAFVPSYGSALVIGGALAFLGGISIPMAGSGMQTVTPSGMRGVAAALLTLSIALAGVAVAPALIGVMTDYVFGDPAKVGWSIGLVCTFSTLVASATLHHGLPGFRARLAILSERREN